VKNRAQASSPLKFIKAPGNGSRSGEITANAIDGMARQAREVIGGMWVHDDCVPGVDLIRCRCVRLGWKPDKPC